MTKAQRKAHKKGNQQRKAKILAAVDKRGKRSYGGFLGCVCQNGRK